MTDIVERARAAQHSILPQPELIKKLADEIERLRAAAPAAAPTREEIYDATLRELETRHPIPTTVLLATRITNAILALKAAPAKSEVHHVTLGSDLDDGQRGKERE